ncbi:hypothetical protein [Propionicimonas sp.]|uniref:SMODS-associated NUDIX domain-containing protein n=1 Tax=Propionicimonas sp. TaxID=1955623 RepID=UPI00182E122C|nr:hypothetical protein [Propionicimonas sp.]MBU3975892.1 hypothetical protein [Actinomycetota bacterium]MBA3019709.1 hypothetical protein [Propionicimonas sp.]MBU3987599.1 hypothetical protein [Actinomycetota bacterium]MBU4006466.1 hypothetical protein [Actinomycetota bacterium]MBU4066646.1 hypothetical protein [Actinomycetota bacterium]
MIVYLVGLVASLLWMSWSDPTSGWFAIPSGLAIGFGIPLLDAFMVNFRLLNIVWYALRTWRGRVRISASYLYRIRVDNEYLLVKGGRFDQFQPVGGVYKSHPSSAGRRDQLGVLDDNLLVPDAVSEGDLRVRVPGKNLLSFVRWFEQGQGRETDGCREFNEELVATGLLPQDLFQTIKYDTLGRHYEPMRYSQWAQSEELLIADILELLPTPAQMEALRQLKADESPQVLWASESQIRRLGATEGLANQTTRIAQTATWTIDIATWTRPCCGRHRQAI